MQATYLTTQLRDSAPYVREAGWAQTAELLMAAAAEIESPRSQVSEAKPAIGHGESADTLICGDLVRTTPPRRSPPASCVAGT